MAADDPQIHPTAEVEPGARIGAGTRVWRDAHVRKGAVIGTGCTIGANVFVDAGVRIGNRAKIQNNVSVYAGVEIGDEVLVGPAAVFTNDRHPRATGEWSLVPTRVERGASIGANATVVCGVVIGEGALVAAGAVVTTDVEAYELVAGNPARRQGWVCECGRTLARTSGRGEPRPTSWRCSGCGRSSGSAPIPLHSVDVGPEAERLVRQVLRSGQLAEGPLVAQFEREWAALVGVRHAVAVTSGTSALLLALRAHGIGPGDEVVTTPVTFAATVSTILETGATARFADVGPDGTLDPESLRQAITSRTRAVVPVHLYGLPADMAAITAIAGEAGVTVIEDCAQAAGARFEGRAVGSFGTGCFSFYATKNVALGEGGMVTTDDDAIAERLRMLRNHGRGGGGEHVLVGHNYRMTDLAAAVGLSQLARLEGQNERRRANARRLNEGLAGIPGLDTPAEPPGRISAYSLYTVRIHQRRDEVADRFRQEGVECAVYYSRLVFDHPAFRDHPHVVRAAVPHAESMVAEVLSLPVHPQLSPADLEAITEITTKIVGLGSPDGRAATLDLEILVEEK